MKKWKNRILGVIGLMSFLVMMSECDDTITFISSHLIATGIFILTIYLASKNSRKNDL